MKAVDKKKAIGGKQLIVCSLVLGFVAVALYASLILGDVLQAYSRNLESDVVTREGASVILFDDMLHPIEGASIRVSNGIKDAQLTTDESGQTQWMQLGSESDVQLIVDDSVVPDGLGLGFHCEIDAVRISTSGYFAHFWHIAVTQPIARKVIIKSDATRFQNLYPADLAYPHWRIGVPSNSELDFELLAAPLLDSEAIKGYQSYRGGGQIEQPYIKGLVLVVPNVDLGEAGLVIGIDLLDKGIESARVDAIHYSAEGGGVPSGKDTDFKCHDLFIQGGVLYVRLGGVLPAGQLGLFARLDSAVEGRMQWLASNPQKSKGARVKNDSPLESESRKMNLEPASNPLSLSGIENSTSVNLFDREGAQEECCEPELPVILDQLGRATKVPAFLPGAEGTAVIREERFSTFSSTPVYCLEIDQRYSDVSELSEKLRVVYAVAGAFDVMEKPIQTDSGFVYGRDGRHGQSNSTSSPLMTDAQQLCRQDYVVFRNRLSVSSLHIDAMRAANNGHGFEIQLGLNELEIGSLYSKVLRRSALCRLR